MANSSKVNHPFFFTSSTRNFKIVKTTKIGRKSTDIDLKDPKLSSEHCLLKVESMGLIVKDLGSTNGTYLNGIKLNVDREYDVRLGDQLRFGSREYKVTDYEVKTSEPRLKKKGSFYNFFGIANGWKWTYAGICLLLLICNNFITVLEYDGLPESLSFFVDLAFHFRRILMCAMVPCFTLGFLFHAYVSQVYLKKSASMRSCLFILICLLMGTLSIFVTVKTYSSLFNYAKWRKFDPAHSGENLATIDLKFKQARNELVKILPEEHAQAVAKDYDLVIKTRRAP